MNVIGYSLVKNCINSFQNQVPAKMMSLRKDKFLLSPSCIQPPTSPAYSSNKYFLYPDNISICKPNKQFFPMFILANSNKFVLWEPIKSFLQSSLTISQRDKPLRTKY